MDVGLPGLNAYHSKHAEGTPEYWADLTAHKMLNIADTAPPVIRDQAVEFKRQLRDLVYVAICRAIRAEQLATAAMLDSNGEKAATQAVMSRVNWRP
jgi:hypothetical protein